MNLFSVGNSKGGTHGAVAAHFFHARWPEPDKIKCSTKSGIDVPQGALRLILKPSRGVISRIAPWRDFSEVNSGISG